MKLGNKTTTGSIKYTVFSTTFSTHVIIIFIYL